MNQGILYAVAAYLAWGLLPLYWKLFQEMTAWEVLGHRIVWSVVFVAVLLWFTGRWRHMWGAGADLKKKAAVVASSVLISANWLIYIWAVNNGHVIEASLGYYINPLINVLFGVLFLKERLHLGQWIAIGLAAAGVSIITVEYGQIPWIALSLALTFACYGLAKKVVQVDSVIGLAWGTLLVFPLAFLYLIGLHVKGIDTASSLTGWYMALLSMAGVATALPLYWFALATKRLPLSTVGFIQYLSPSTSLLLAIFVFGESFTAIHFISFGLIWSALAVFTFTSVRKKQHPAPVPSQEALIEKEA